MSESQFDALRREIDNILKRIARSNSDQEIKALDLHLATVYRAIGNLYMQSGGLNPSQKVTQANYYLGMAIRRYELYPEFDAGDQIAEIYEEQGHIFEGMGTVNQDFYKSAESYYQSAVRHAKTQKSYYEETLASFRQRRKK